jgi:hypothetical protein
MLNSVLRSERIYLADFTMFVFDECHHCDKQHPYKSGTIETIKSVIELICSVDGLA